MEELIEKILKKMEEIEYGWADKDGVIHTHSGRDFFLNNYRLQSIDETLGFKVGTCWEQVELIRYYFDKEFIDIDTYIVIYNEEGKIARHTIAVAHDFAGYYWVDSAWKRDHSIKFSSVEEILNTLIGYYPRMYKIPEFDIDKIEIYKYSRPEPGLTYEEFTDFCRKQEKIDLNEYYMKKLTNFYINSDMDLFVNSIQDRDSYKLVHSDYSRSYKFNYITNVNDREFFDSIENEAAKDMKLIDGAPSIIVMPESKLFNDSQNVIDQNRYKENVYSWKIFDKFYNIEKIESKTDLKPKLIRTTDMQNFADMYVAGLDDNELMFASGYKLCFKNYKGPKSPYNRDMYFIKNEGEIIGTVITTYDNEIFEIDSLNILESYRNQGIGTKILIDLLKTCKEKGCRVCFTCVNKEIGQSDFYNNRFFIDYCYIYHYIKNNSSS